jgi:hypothetical protein
MIKPKLALAPPAAATISRLGCGPVRLNRMASKTQTSAAMTNAASIRYIRWTGQPGGLLKVPR